MIEPVVENNDVMNTGANKDVLIQLLQSENKTLRLTIVDMRKAIKVLEEGIKMRDTQIEEIRMLNQELVRRLKAE